MDSNLHHDKPEQHLKSNNFFRDVVIGMSDGLTVPFALAVGLSGAVDNNKIIVIAGIAIIAAGSITMGLGGYMSGKPEHKHNKRGTGKSEHGKENLSHTEIEQTKEFFANLGLSESLQEQVTEDIAKDKDRWDSFMAKHELGLDKPDPRRAIKTALNIGLSYVVGGIIPLIPYFIFAGSAEALPYSIVVTLASLFIFGYFKSKLSGQYAWWGALRVTAIAALAAAAAYGVAKLF